MLCIASSASSVGMTDSNPNFANVGRDLNITTDTINEPVLKTGDLKKHAGTISVNDSGVEDTCKYIVKAPRPDSKLILQNMEEVLNSVKKKHRQKHRRKKEQRKLAQMEAAAVAVATAELEKMEGLQTEGNISNDKPRTLSRKSIDEKYKARRSKSKPLQENTVQENGLEVSSNSGRKGKLIDIKSPLKNYSANGDILRHFQRTPKKNQSNDIEKIQTKGNPADKMNVARTSAAASQPKTMNAFEVMMNARNKTIGSNTPGKEISPTASQETKPGNTKRRLILQEWADKMGGTKRKLEEETRAAYVEEQLENRAKRFKHMLVQEATPNEYKTPTSRTASARRKSQKLNISDNQSDVKPKRKKRINRLLMSIESDDDDVEVIVRPDNDTEEFLSKLHSPTKKRDSLLGYFPRKESPTEIDTKNTKETKSKSLSISNKAKSRTRRSIKSNIVTNNTPATPVKEDISLPIVTSPQEAEKNTPSGRPKRSCAGKARYDYDLEVSPTKLASTSNRKGEIKSKRDESFIEKEIIINLDDSNMSLSPEKCPKKLAPVFVRALPKPSPDPVAVKARYDFLMSGVPEKVRLEMEKQKQYEQFYDEALAYFPLVCHVQQFSVDDTQFLTTKPDFSLKLKLPDNYDNYDKNTLPLVTSNSKVDRRRSRCNTVTTTKSKSVAKGEENRKIITSTIGVLLPTVENKRAIIKCWKSEFDRFPTFKCYNQMREKYRFFSALDSAQDMEQVSESFVVTRQKQRKRNADAISSISEQDDVKPPATAPNGELLFTEKYKPMLVEQVLVNLVPVTQLRDFLAAWASGNSGSARNSQTMDDSFDASNDSVSSLSNLTSNAVVLLGPASSGKTNAVYALANDLNFNVLEINAGMKRTGKRLIQELQEATQSHQIRKDTTSTPSASKAQKNLLRMSLNGQKLKKQNSQGHLDGDSSSTDINQNSRKCLILIEDADVVFDQLDNGFIDAIYTLAASSKRPVIVMATNPNCAHLQRLMNQNTIHFTPPNALHISRFMAVLSLIENCPINLDDLLSLYLYNGKDLRRTLLEIQFFIQSGGDRRLMATLENNRVQQRTPQKDEGKKRESGYFASPTKRCLSEEEDDSQQSQEPDEQLGRDRANAQGEKKSNSVTDAYIHRSLFEFFTCNQNEIWRIPFPIDFSLLRVNLNEVFQCSERLQLPADCTTEHNKRLPENAGEKNVALKRRTRTPKKSLANSVVTDKEVGRKKTAKQPFDMLCDFYENISIAALLGTHNADMSEGSALARCKSGIAGGGSDVAADRLLPHLSEHIAHDIVEDAISVNLGAKTCPYNLFNTPTERLSLCDYMNSTAISSRGQRTRTLDVEPALRAICRSEKHRAMKERRSTRFYHYLRHSAVNVSSFSTEPFDKVCSILQCNNFTASEEEQTTEAINVPK